MKTSLTICLLMAFFLPINSQIGFVVDHRNTALSEIPDNWIDSAKTNLKIRYFRRSHGSQVDVGGMDALRRYSTNYATKFNYSADGFNGALEMSTHWYSLDFENDQWVQITRDYLDNQANSHINTIMWAWSSYFFSCDVEQYINDMEMLIADYGPGGTKIQSGERTVPVTFIFQTACSQRSNDRNQIVFEKNQRIREHCRYHNRILFDFNDLESYDPDGSYFGDGNPDGTYTNVHMLNDDCSYNRGDGSRGNWGIEWNNVNPGTELAQLSADDICTVCEHSMGAVEGEIKDNSRLHCVLKGQAVWYLWAKLAGWNDKSLNIVPDVALDESNLEGRRLSIELSNCRFSGPVLSTNNFVLNNAPSGLSIKSVSYIDENSAVLVLSFDGTSIENDINDFSLTILANDIECAQYISSNALVINSLYVINVTWSGSVNNDWNLPENWSTGTLPNSNCDVVIPAGAEFYPETNSGASFSLNNLTLQSGTWMQFPVGNSLSIANYLTLYSSADSYSQIIDNENINVYGNINYYKFLPASSYHYIASPLSEVPSTIFTSSTLGYNPNFYVYDETNNSTDWLLGWNHNLALGNLPIGKGYAYFFKADQTIKLTGGTLNSGDIAIEITNSNHAVLSDGWNLIGNPYSSAISADEFVYENRDVINGTLYFWNDDKSKGTDYSTNDYALWNLAGAIGTGTGTSSEGGTKIPDGFIAPMQGFFVKKINPGTGQIWFRNNMRTFGNGQYFKSMDGPKRLKLSLINSSLKLYNELLVAFVEGATNRFDNLYDGLKLRGNPKISFYSLLNNSELGIQSFKRNANADTQSASVALGMFVENAGDYEIDVAGNEGFSVDMNVYLEDKLLKKFHSLNNGGYNFYLGAGECNTRFVLHINPPKRWLKVISSENQSFVAYYSDNELIVEVIEPLIGAELIVYNISGVPLIDTKIDCNRMSIPIETSNSTLLIKLKSKDLELSKKLIIN